MYNEEINIIMESTTTFSFTSPKNLKFRAKRRVLPLTMTNGWVLILCTLLFVGTSTAFMQLRASWKFRMRKSFVGKGRREEEQLKLERRVAILEEKHDNVTTTFTETLKRIETNINHGFKEVKADMKTMDVRLNELKADMTTMEARMGGKIIDGFKEVRADMATMEARMDGKIDDGFKEVKADMVKLADKVDDGFKEVEDTIEKINGGQTLIFVSLAVIAATGFKMGEQMTSMETKMDKGLTEVKGTIDVRLGESKESVDSWFKALDGKVDVGLKEGREATEKTNVALTSVLPFLRLVVSTLSTRFCLK